MINFKWVTHLLYNMQRKKRRKLIAHKSAQEWLIKVTMINLNRIGTNFFYRIIGKYYFSKVDFLKFLCHQLTGSKSVT